MAVNAAPSRGASFLLHAADPRDVHTPEDTTNEIVEFASTVRQFIATEVQPRFDEIDDSHGAPIPGLMQGLADLGFFSAEVPESLGGLGLGLRDTIPLICELGRAGSFGVAAMVHQGIGMQPLVLAGSPELTSQYIADLTSARMLAAYALTEPGAGSDALNGTSNAVQGSDGHWTIDGSKQFITNAMWAGMFQVFAQVPGHGLTAFVVERSNPGLEVLPEEHKMGIRGSSTCALRLKGVRVAPDRVLGTIGKGHKIAMNMLNIGRLKLGSTMVGAMKQVLAHALQYSGERRQFGAPISSFGMTRQKFAEMAALTFAGEAIASRVAGQIDRLALELPADRTGGGSAKLAAAEEFAMECSISKFWLTEAANICADHAVQIYGGYGFVEEYPVARYYRDLRVSRLYEGTNEINRINVWSTFTRRVFKGGDGEAVREGLRAAQSSGGDAAAPVRRVAARFFEAVLGPPATKPPRVEQDVVWAIADIAAELFAAESAMNRAARIQSAGEIARDLRELAGHLGALSLARAARLVADRANSIAGPIEHELDGTLQLDLAACAEIARERIRHERAAAALLIEAGNEMPEFR